MRNQTNISQLNGSLTAQKGFTAGSYSANTSRGWFRKFLSTIGTNQAQRRAYQNGVEESEGERETGESETNIFKQKQTIHLGLKVTLSYYLLLAICKFISDLFHKVSWTLAN